MMHYCMRSLLLSLLLLFTASATEIHLKNGTVYNGTIVAEDAGFFSLKVAKKTVAINKTLVAKVDGNTFSPRLSSTTNPASAPDSKNTTVSPGKSASADRWRVSLNNGSVFFGKRISENKRVLVLESKGAPVTIFKNMISAIDSGKSTVDAGVKPEAVVQNSGNVSVTQLNTATASSVVAPRKASSATVERERQSDKSSKVAPEPANVSPASAQPTPRTQSVSARSTPVKPVPQGAPAALVNSAGASVNSGQRGSLPMETSKKFSALRVAFGDTDHTETDKTGASATQEKTVPAAAVGSLPPPRSRMTMVAFSDNPSSGAEERELLNNAADSSPVAAPVANTFANATDTRILPSDSDEIKVYTAPLPAFVKARRKDAAAEKRETVPSAGTAVPIPEGGVPPASDLSIDKQLHDTPNSTQTSIAQRRPPPQEVEVIPQLQLAVSPQAAPRRATADTTASVVPNKLVNAVATAPPPLLMAPSAAPKAYVKRTDGKVEIVLTSGTKFVGTVQNDGKHAIAFVADGAIITILKRLIKEIDGEPYTYDKPAGVHDEALASATRANSTMKKQQLSKAQQILFRIMPTAELIQGTTIESLIDSMNNSTDWRARSRAIRLVGAMGPWGVSAIPAVSLRMSDTAQNYNLAPLYLDSIAAEELLPPALEAARTLAQLGNQGVSELMKAYRSNVPHLRKSAVFGLGNCFYDAAVRVVKEAASDEDAELRRLALSSLRIPDALPFLITACKDKDPQVRAAAVFLMGKMSDRGSISQIIKMVHDKNSFVRTMAAGALALRGTKEELVLLKDLCKDRDNLVRAAAVRGLGSIEDSSGVDLCIAATRDSSAEVRLGAVDAMRTIKNSRSIPTLYSLVKDPHQQVREKAELALREHTEIPLLIAALDSESAMVRGNVAYILWLLTAQPFAQDKVLWDAWAAEQQGKKTTTPKNFATRDVDKKKNY